MFADYMSEDVVTAEDAFNEALKECNTEQERQKLITDTLTALYGDAATKYEEASGAQLAAKEATAENTLAQTNLASTIEPLTTAWQTLKTDALEAITPVIEDVSEGMTDALEWLREHPVLLKALAVTVGVLSAALTIAAVSVGIYTAAQWAMNSAILANPMTWIIMGVIAAIAVLAGIIVVIIEYWDEIVEGVKTAFSAVGDFFSDLGESIGEFFSTIGTWINTNLIQPIANFFSGLITGITTGIQNAWNWCVNLFSTIGTWIYTNVIQPVVNFFIGLWQGIVSAYHTVIDPWVEIIKRAAALAYENIIKPIADFFVGLWNGITSGLQSAWDWIVELASSVAGWIDENVVQPVAKFFSDLWQGVSDGLQSAWDSITGIFSTVSSWVDENVIQPVARFFSNMWDGFKNGAKNAWQGVKDTFSKVASFFGDIFSKAWQKVKDVFSVGGKIFDGIKDGIVSAFKSVVNTIIKGINKVVRVPLEGLNGVLNRISNISILNIKPFSWLTWRAPIPEIPLLAKGGIVDRPTLNIAGEAGTEAIIPIDKLETYIISAIDKTMQIVNLQSLVYAIEALANRAIQLNINGQRFAEATAVDTDTVSGGRMELSKRGLAL